jgi:hypothetical protein
MSSDNEKVKSGVSGDGKSGELTNLRDDKYALLGLGIALLSAIVGFFVRESQEFMAGVFFSVSTSIVISYFIQKIQNKTIEKTMVENISSKIEEVVSVNITEIRDIVAGKENGKNPLSPSITYIGGIGGDLLFDKDLNSCLEKSSNFHFMSISAKYLLDKRLIEARSDTLIKIQLLLLDPTDLFNLNFRVSQLKRCGREKSIDEQKKEIIDSVFKAYKLCNNYREFNIKFHKETLLFRMELFSETLFMSYYESQKKGNFGPVARYERECDVFKSLRLYFNEVWKKNNEMVLMENYKSEDVRSELHKRFPSCTDIINESFNEIIKSKNL